MTPHQTAAAALGIISPAGDRVNDEGLVERARRGELAAFNQLVLRHYAGVFEVARRLTPGPDDAADIAQEVFIAAWQRLPRFQPRASFRTWLHAITLKRCAQSVRGARRRPASLQDLAGTEPSVMDGTQARLEREETEAALRAAIQALPRAQREAIVLHYFGELSCAETAGAMGISTGSVMTHLFRARKNLRAALGTLVEEEELP
jgi:RNA polymerase sigma-70 factor (ECF subfamily)